jgi:hypothetical protein
MSVRIVKKHKVIDDYEAVKQVAEKYGISIELARQIVDKYMRTKK